MVLYARDILEKDFVTLSRTTSVLDAARVMRTSKRGFVVIGLHTKPEGIITEWDILSKVVAEGRDPATVKLEEIMTTQLIYVSPGESIAAISQLMSEKGIRRILVEEKGDVIGYITSRTVLANLNAYVDKVSSQISRLQAPWF